MVLLFKRHFSSLSSIILLFLISICFNLSNSSSHNMSEVLMLKKTFRAFSTFNNSTTYAFLLLATHVPTLSFTHFSEDANCSLVDNFKEVSYTYQFSCIQIPKIIINKPSNIKFEGPL